MYEPFIYQLYNITMTSLPIMYFALFDFEYEKENLSNCYSKQPKQQLYFMKNPLLYKKSMESRYFSKTLFVCWLFYAVVHAIILYIVSFYAIEYF